MPKIDIDRSDGRYYVKQLTDEQANALETNGYDVAHVEDAVWEEYRRHVGSDGIWQALWRTISNDQYLRRRERELMPLEDAKWEIQRLKAELERAERMAKHYEESFTRVDGAVRGVRHRAREYTCVFPKPGCKVEILPPAWQDRAREILAKYRADLAEEGMLVQGCCCDYGEHQKLHDATVAELRAAGFIVAHDAEVDEEES